MMEPPVAQQIVDRKTQREQLRCYFLANPDAFWTQETLAAACGADLGAVRTRISELREEGLSLVWQFADFTDAKGVYHRGKKLWKYQLRPAEPLGPDAGEKQSGQRRFWPSREHRL